MSNSELPSCRLKSNQKSFDFIFIFIFFVALVTGPISRAQVTKSINCKKDWGQITHLPGSEHQGCIFKTDLSGAPSSFSILGFRWNAINDVLSLRIKLKEGKALSGLKMSFYNRGSLKANYELPLYTDPEYNILQENLWTTLSIPRSQLKWVNGADDNFEEVFDTLKIYIASSKGQSVTINIDQMILDHRHKEGRISITFDDGYSSNFTAAEIMKPLGLSGTAFLIPKAFNLKGHLRDNQIKMMKSWGWSLSTHLETPVTQVKELDKLLNSAKEKISHVGGKAGLDYFALPLGKYNSQTLEILKKQFKVVRLAGGGFETLPVKDPYRLKTINVTMSMSPDEVYQLCKKAIDNHEWAILMFHYLGQPDKGDLNYSIEDYRTLMKKLSTLKKYVKPVDWVI